MYDKTKSPPLPRTRHATTQYGFALRVHSRVTFPSRELRSRSRLHKSLADFNKRTRAVKTPRSSVVPGSPRTTDCNLKLSFHVTDILSLSNIEKAAPPLCSFNRLFGYSCINLDRPAGLLLNNPECSWTLEIYQRLRTVLIIGVRLPGPR